MFEFRVMLVTFLSFPFKKYSTRSIGDDDDFCEPNKPKVCLCSSDEGLFFIVLVVIMME